MYSKSGFKNSSEGTRLYEPVDNADQYTITYTYLTNGSSGDTSLDVEAVPYEGRKEWALAPLPEDYHGDISYQTEEEAVVGQNMVYFGNYTMTTIARNCHNIRFVVPAAVDFGRNQTAILKSLLYADRILGGIRYDQVTIFTTPEKFIDIGGFARESDIVVSTNSELYNSEPRTHLWLHEYIHTRQSSRPTSRMKWWTEASAQYLGLRLAFESGYMTPRQYNEQLRLHVESIPEEIVLANTSTWKDYSTYSRGLVVLALLDQQLRNQTDGSVNMIYVFNIVESNEAISLTNFTHILSNEAGNGSQKWVRTYIQDSTEISNVPTAETTIWNSSLLLGGGLLIIILLLGVFLSSGRSGDELRVNPDHEYVERFQKLAQDEDADQNELFNDVFERGLDEVSSDFEDDS